MRDVTTPRTEQFKVEFDDGWTVERMPIGVAAGHMWTTLVFSREEPLPSERDHDWNPHEELGGRIRVKGVDGKLGHGRGGGGGNSRRYAMNTAPELNDTTTIEITYAMGRKTYARETIWLGIEKLAAEPTAPVPLTSKVLFDDMVPVHYGYFYLSAGEGELGDLNDARRGQKNGLCGALIPNQASLVTGLHTGEVPLVVEWHPNEPPVAGAWEDVVEVSVEFPDTDVLMSSFEDAFGLELPVSGWHRVRYCGSGMDEGKELDTPDDDEEAPDRYLLQMWPAPDAPDEIKLVGSRTAEYWHGVAGQEPLGTTAKPQVPN